MQRGEDGTIVFRRRTAPTALDTPDRASSAWFGPALAILALAAAVVLLLVWVGSTTAYVRLFEERRLPWFLATALAVVAFLGAWVRHRRRPRMIVFDPTLGHVRLIPGGAVPYNSIDGIHAFAWRDLSRNEPVQRYQVYLRIGGHRITLAELPSMQQAEALARELNNLAGAV
jgi:hypothetical protein